MKKVLSFILALTLLISAANVFALPVFGEEIVRSGYCGAEGNETSLAWKLTADGTVTISGRGRMGDYDGIKNTSPFAYSNSVNKVVIENGVTSIGDYAFYYCRNLTSIAIPNSVTSIGDTAFGECYGLTSVTLPYSVTSIGYDAFWCTGLTSITIPSSIISIGFGAFKIQSLKQIYVDAANQKYCSVDGVLFSKDKTELVCYPGGKTDASYTVPNTVTRIGSDAFYSDYLTSITIPNSVILICDGAFNNCLKLTSIAMPNSVISIGNNAFFNCPKLTSISIPNSVTSIGDEAFWGCSSLTSIAIPDSVMSIGCDSFDHCTNLKDIYCEVESKPEGWSNDWNKSNATVHWGYKKSVPGDTDGDGKVNTNDIIYLLNYLIFDEDYPVNQNVDFDGNGKANTYDAIYLLNHLIFEDEYPLS